MWSGVCVFEGVQMGMIVHTAYTVVLDRQGRVIAILKGISFRLSNWEI